MFVSKVISLNQLLLLLITSSETLKIGISKHLPLTSTVPTPNSTVDSLTEQAITVVEGGDTIELLIETTTSVDEWPDFPPKKPTQAFPNTTTEIPSKTTIRILTTTDVPNETVENKDASIASTTQIMSLPKWPNKQIYCSCDLLRETCDINCCCDRDCSADALKVFRCLPETALDIELVEGRFDDFKFQHGLPSCEVSDGWLCVFKTNNPVGKAEGSYSLKDTSYYNNWPNLLMESEDIRNREFFKYGDLMRVINIETKHIQIFDLPSSFESSSCNIREPIYYLKSTKKSCLISSKDNLKEIQLWFIELQDQYKIFKAPIIPDDIYNQKQLTDFVGNITLHICFKNSCSSYQKNKKIIEYYNLINVKVNILHNFTHIHEVVVALKLENSMGIKYSNTTKQEYWLSYEIEFYNRTLKNYKQTLSEERKLPTVSGPLGYLLSRPLIKARYQPYNKSQPLSTNNQVLSYFSINKTESYVLTLLNKENGVCTHSKASQDFLSYGINVANYCKIKVINNSVVDDEPSHINFTKICLNLQRLIHDQLFGQDIIIEELSSYYISQLGKPQNISSKWVQLQVYNTDFDSVLGQYLSESNTFVCRNILLSLSYEFHMAALKVDNIPNQNVIQRAVLHLAERHDLEFSLNENLEVPITMAVRFYDVLEKVVSSGNNIVLFYKSFYIICILIKIFNLH